MTVRNEKLIRCAILALMSCSLLITSAGCTAHDAPPAVLQEQQPADSSASSLSSTAALNVQDALIPMGKSSGVFYEIFVRSYADSNGDGIGDFNGITAKLNYLQDLGIKGIWLMPINPSPSYHGYDVTDYYAVNPDYGNLDDLKHLLEEAHKRDIQIIMDLVLNHTSSEHPWFVDSAKGTDSTKRDWYVWAEDQQMDTGKLGAWGQQAWHKRDGNHYLGVFWDGMPDLNMNNEEVRAELKKIAHYWLDLGMDGFRLDAAKHVYEDFQNTGQTPEVIEANRTWWHEFREAVESSKPGAYLAGEIWDAPAVIGPFLDKSFQSAFNFDMAGRMISMVESERDADIGSMMSRIYSFYSKSSNGTFVDAPFLSNHDQDRVMTQVSGKLEHAKMAASVLLTLPGNPFMYYGEEIGMQGAKPDELIREPMRWTEDTNEPENTSWEAPLSNSDTVSVEQQLQDEDSLLLHYKKMIALRNQDPVLQDGGIMSYMSGVAQVAGYVRATQEDKRLVLHNLSGETQSVTLTEAAKGTFGELSFASRVDAVLADGEVTIPPYSTVVLSP